MSGNLSFAVNTLSQGRPSPSWCICTGIESLPQLIGYCHVTVKAHLEADKADL
jgi:hypothetical protein